MEGFNLGRRAMIIIDPRHIFTSKALRIMLLLVMASRSLELHAKSGEVENSGPHQLHGDIAGPLTSPPTSDEIVVTAETRGEAKVAAESEFSESEIAGQGTNSIQELLARLGPHISNDGEEPIILINGKPIGYDRSILSYPTEALVKLAILKPEASTFYGESAGKRVVNLVLKKNFRSWTTDLGSEFPTAGGRMGGKFAVTHTAISGDTRWNARAEFSAESKLLKSARNLGPVDYAGNKAQINSAVDKIDPKVSNYETLIPSLHDAFLGIGVTRPVGDFSATLNINATHNRSEALRGLAQVLYPAGTWWSLTPDNAELADTYEGKRALRHQYLTTSLGPSVALSGQIGEWQANLSVSYSRSWAKSFMERAVEERELQRLNATPSEIGYPFDGLKEKLVLASRSNSQGENFSLRANLRRSIFELPAGAVVWTLTANSSRNLIRSIRQERYDLEEYHSNRVRNLSNLQMGLSVPLSERGTTKWGGIGDLTVDLTINAQKLTGSRLNHRKGANFTWLPFPHIQFRGSILRARSGPSVSQLDEPITSTIGRIFDYIRLEVAEPLWITGGNPDLKRGTQNNLTFAVQIRPFGTQRLGMNFGYRKSISEGEISGLPELSPVIEAAFPERITRDEEGRLVRVDARAINTARGMDTDLTTGLTIRLSDDRKRPKQGLQSVGTSNAVQVNLSINHSWRLKSEFMIREGMPIIDQMRDMGQSRHSISLQTNLSKNGIGATLVGNWSSPALMKAGTGGSARYTVKPPLKFNLSTFIEPDRLYDYPLGRRLLSGLKFAVEVQNLTNSYRRLVAEDGGELAGYSRSDVDPLGRTIRISLRKKF